MTRWIRQFGSVAANSAAFEKLIGRLEQTDDEQGDLLRVLTYHRIDEPQARPWLDPVLLSATPEAFEAQVKYLAANYELVSVVDVIKAFDHEVPGGLPARAVLITFDDAYLDFEKYAWPILQKYQAPAVLFVPTAFPDHPERWFWWDRVFHALNTTHKGELNLPAGKFSLRTTAERRRAFKHLKKRIKSLPNDIARKEVDQLCSELAVNPQSNCVLGWDALRKLSKEGLVLGAHTRTHPILNHITFDSISQEISASVQDLTHETGFTPQTFAYPSGIHNEDVVKAVEQAGIRLAFTTERGINKVGRANRLRLRRINVGARTTMPVLRAQLLSWTANLYPSRKPL